MNDFPVLRYYRDVDFAFHCLDAHVELYVNRETI